MTNVRAATIIPTGIDCSHPVSPLSTDGNCHGKFSRTFLSLCVCVARPPPFPLATLLRLQPRRLLIGRVRSRRHEQARAEKYSH
ncbi:hypothetical protein BaRGS_00040394 [Batillaria attramentaria]|uniref:Uncharacterized protein n=1 Tax=Batillaria attramentaria TaxID=370345 RepID=A0ABD0J098_9CAEN